MSQKNVTKIWDNFLVKMREDLSKKEELLTIDLSNFREQAARDILKAQDGSKDSHKKSRKPVTIHKSKY